MSYSLATGVDYLKPGFSSLSEAKVPFRRLHRHDEVEIGVNEHYPVVALVGAERIVLPPNRLLVFWGARPHGPVETTSGGWAYAIHVPLAWFLRWELSPALTRPLLAGQVLMSETASAPSSDLAQLKNWTDLLRRNGDEGRRIVLLEIEARLRRLGLELSSKLPARRSLEAAICRSDTALYRFEQMTTLIAKHYLEPLCVDDIAEAVGMHPSAAMRLFRKIGGGTLLESLTQHRVQHAQHLLATTNQQITAIALESGFASVSRFYSAFQEAVGVSPGEYRRSLGLPKQG